jgi:hypothetical protein
MRDDQQGHHVECAPILGHGSSIVSEIMSNDSLCCSTEPLEQKKNQYRKVTSHRRKWHGCTTQGEDDSRVIVESFDSSAFFQFSQAQRIANRCRRVRRHSSTNQNANDLTELVRQSNANETRRSLVHNLARTAHSFDPIPTDCIASKEKEELLKMGLTFSRVWERMVSGRTQLKPKKAAMGKRATGGGGSRCMSYVLSVLRLRTPRSFSVLSTIQVPF